MRCAVIQNQWSVDLKDCYRQYQSNGAAFFAALGYFYLAVVLSGNLAYKGKTQTGTAHGAAAGFVHTVERIKDFLLIFRGDTDACVSYPFLAFLSAQGYNIYSK